MLVHNKTRIKNIKKNSKLIYYKYYINELEDDKHFMNLLK
jgi:hypothetical protein